MGIEPTLSAWKAEVLPLNYTRKICVGGRRIRTFEGIRRQIYSLIPLAARESLQGIAGNRNRTRDRLITNQLLCLLSYASDFFILAIFLLGSNIFFHLDASFFLHILI